MKKLYIVLSIIFMFSMIAINAKAELSDAEDSDMLINDGRVIELGNKYIALISSVYEEDSSRIGARGYYYELESRDKQTEMSKVKALETINDNLNTIDAKSLSPYVYASYYALKENIGIKMHRAVVVNYLNNNPVWYLDSIESLYDLIIKDFLPDQDKLSYSLKRLEMFPQIFQEAQKNLQNPPDLYLKLAIEKGENYYNNFQEISYLLNKVAKDKYTKNRVKEGINNAKKALLNYITFLKNMIKNKKYVDFRLGEKEYKKLYENVYFVPLKYKNLEGFLEDNLQVAYNNLVQFLDPIALPLLTVQEKARRLAEIQAKENSKKEKRAIEELEKEIVKPQDYYLAISTYTIAPASKKILLTYAKEFENASKFFFNKKIFPKNDLQVLIGRAPKGFQNKISHITYWAPTPLLDDQNPRVFISLPKNDEQTKKEFNYGAIKFESAEFINPGMNLTYSMENLEQTILQKLATDPFYINGWTKYAIDTAYKAGYFDTTQDKLNALWFDYKKAVYALIDYKLHTKEFNYTASIEYAFNAGINIKEAEDYIQYLALNPLYAVSYIVGDSEIVRLKNKYQKKYGDNFNLMEFHKHLLSIGRVPLIGLEPALDKAYSSKEVDSYFAMTYF